MKCFAIVSALSIILNSEKGGNIKSNSVLIVKFMKIKGESNLVLVQKTLKQKGNPKTPML